MRSKGRDFRCFVFSQSQQKSNRRVELLQLELDACFRSAAGDQIRNPADISQLMVPLQGTGPYLVIGEGWQQSHTTNIQNICKSCRRPQCTDHFQNYTLDELQMPAPFAYATEFDHNTISNADRQAVRDWCATLNLLLFTG